MGMQDNVLRCLDIDYSYRLARRMEQYRSNPALGYRPAGSEAERLTGEMLRQEMLSLGLKNVRREEFRADGWEFHHAMLRFDTPNGPREAVLGAYQTTLVTSGWESCQLVYVGRGGAKDYAGLDVRDKLVLVDINQRDEWWINYPVYQAHLKGAKALIAVQRGGCPAHQQRGKHARRGLQPARQSKEGRAADAHFIAVICFLQSLGLFAFRQTQRPAAPGGREAAFVHREAHAHRLGRFGGQLRVIRRRQAHAGKDGLPVIPQRKIAKQQRAHKRQQAAAVTQRMVEGNTEAAAAPGDVDEVVVDGLAGQRAQLRGAGIVRTPVLIMLGSFVAFRQVYLFIISHVHNTPALAAFGYPMGWILCTILMLICFRRSVLGQKAPAQEA